MILSEKLLKLLGFLKHIRGHITNCDNEILQQLILVLGWEERSAHEQFVENAAETPHINGIIILYSKHYLRSPVVSTLNIEETSGEVLATRSEVNNLHSGEGLVSEQNILRLHVAVYHSLVLHVLQALANLFRYLFQLLGLEHRIPPSI